MLLNTDNGTPMAQVSVKAQILFNVCYLIWTLLIIVTLILFFYLQGGKHFYKTPSEEPEKVLESFSGKFRKTSFNGCRVYWMCNNLLCAFNSKVISKTTNVATRMISIWL